jgi:glycosyltransferase involved in cell wall biosynthesis
MISVVYCRSNPIAPDPRVEKEARALRMEGYRVMVVGWDRSGDLSSREVRGQVEIFRLRIKSGYARGIHNLPQLLRWQVGLGVWLMRNHRRYDCIHACDFDTVLPALLARFLFRKTVVYDIFDFYADHLRKVPAWIKKIIARIDLWAIGQADAVILADEARRGQIKGSRPRQVHIIYNSPEDTGQPALRTGEFSPSARLKIAYVGLLQVERGLFEMLEILKQHPEWEMAVAGFGGDQEAFLECAKDMPNLHWLGRVPYERAIDLSGAADVLFATYDPAIANHAYSSPNKIFEAMMLGKPVIVARRTNMDAIIERYQVGLVVEYGDVQGLENALRTLSENHKLRGQMAGRARKAYDEVYSWAKMRDRLSRLYQRLNLPDPG